MNMPNVQVKGNVATISDLSGATPLTVKVKANSSFTQRVSITNGADVNLVFSGSGERNSMLGEAQINSAAPLQAIFEFQMNDSWQASKLNCGGPYAIGSYNLLVIVAENGDDSDYNDSIVEFSWYTRR
jgi:hypothetical protein